jgi:hypothetical protein
MISERREGGKAAKNSAADVEVHTGGARKQGAKRDY